MKKIIVFSFLFTSITVSAQNIPADDTTARETITEAGKPNGKITEMQINKDGGTLTSGDGNLELIIPDGALSKKTTISIQPVTNLMPNGNGQAYRLEPSGITFLKPLQLVFHYSPEESEDSMQLLMAIAMQDDQGQWYGLNEFTLDTVAKTISGMINHFSTWAKFDKLKLRTLLGTYRLKVKHTALLGIFGVDMDQSQKNHSNENGLSKLKNWKSPQKGRWCVNTFIKGNAEFGTLEKGIVDESNAKWNDYTAPDNVPSPDPVTISVDLLGASYVINNKTITNLSLKTKILIYDNAYEVKIIQTMGGSAGSVLGGVAYLDTGSFVITLNGNKSKIIEKINKNSNGKLDYIGCKPKLLIPGSGSINMIGGEEITITPATQTEPAKVEIQFKKNPTILPLIQFTCPPIGKGPPTVSTNQMARSIVAISIPAMPMNIRFNAIEGEQELPGTINRDGMYYKVTVRQLKDDE